MVVIKGEAITAGSLNTDNVICETVKKAERDDSTIIRLYESKNVRTATEICLGIPASEVFLCDMMENEIEKLELQDQKVNVTLNGFEIITLKIK